MSSPTLLDHLERRCGHLAIPGLLRVIASFQVICFVLLRLKPAFIEFLLLTPAAWQEWEVWRFFTFCFIPGTTSLIWILFAVMILLLIGNLLESEWGKFRLNLYYFGTVACLWAGILVAGPAAGMALSFQASTLLYSSLFFAFATVVPNYTFMLFFVLPVKVKWLAMLSGVLLAYQMLALPPLRLPILLAMLPYACYSLPLAWRRIRHGARVTARRATYQSNSLPAGPAFHECHVCHRTEKSDPSLEFRIAGDDEEYCQDHLPAGQDPGRDS